MASRPARLSSALVVADVNDFLTPAAACVLPLGGGAAPAAIKPAPAGSFLAPILPRVSASATTAASRPAAAITLSDCLTCSGCVTSAETILLSSASLDKVRAFLLPTPRTPERTARTVVVALSQQAAASIAAELGVSLFAAAGKLATFCTKALGADSVIDLAFARHFALEEAAAEFIRRRRAGEKTVVTSACPGWVTYAEKTQSPDVLAAISRVRSPQAVAGVLVPKMLPTGDGAVSRPVWLMSIMPCHDKKLEAIRPEFQGEDGPEIECVLTAGEMLQLADELNVDLASMPETPLDPRFAAGPSGFGTEVGSGSGGYAEHVLRAAARELLGVILPSGKVAMETVTRSGDVRSITVQSEDGSKVLRFGTAYGFRSLQSVLRKMRRGECEYDYVELMACPGGCNNGGGQVPPAEGIAGDKKAINEVLGRVEAEYYTATNSSVEPACNLDSVAKVYKHVIGGGPGSKPADDMLYTEYQQRQQSSMAELSNW
jgi:iron only hydrogenase large subunit-like protein